MSDQTLQAIEDAIAAHLSDEMGENRMVTGWVGYVSSMSSENLENHTHGYNALTGDGQPFHVSFGLVSMLQADVVYQTNFADSDHDD